VYDGWDGYQTSLVHAIAPLRSEQLAWRPAPNLRSVGEIARHISLGRINWFMRMGAPGSAEVAKRIAVWDEDKHGNRYVVEEAIDIAENAAEQVRWLEFTWQMIDATLKTWTVADLARSYRHTWQGQTYAISNQWTIWRIMAHDIHHGGQLAIMLGVLGIDIPELGDFGGHITQTPLADEK
jgi:uncharacterized damage-inducible protein DinB